MPNNPFTLQNLFPAIAQGYNYYQQGENIEDAGHDLDQGYTAANTRLGQINQPYLDFGLESMQNYQDQGDFEYTHGDYLGSEAYDWLLDEDLRAVARQGAAKKELGSGQTLAGLEERARLGVANLYDEDFQRQLQTYDTNRARNQFGVETGQKTAMNYGDNVANLAIGQGQSKAYLDLAKAQANRANLNAILPYLAGGGGTAAGGGAPTSGGGLANLWSGTGVDDTGQYGYLGDLFAGGGTDDQGNLGLLGDLGGLFSGGYGDNYQFSLPQGSPLGTGNFTYNSDGLLGGTVDFLDDPGFWDSFTSNVGEFAEEAWNGIKDTFSSFFP